MSLQLNFYNIIIIPIKKKLFLTNKIPHDLGIIFNTVLRRQKRVYLRYDS